MKKLALFSDIHGNFQALTSIMNDINNHIIKIFNIKDENGITNVVVYMSISMYDYVVDEKGKVVRGTDKFKALVEYEMTFVKSTEDKIIKCPNCGAELDIVTGGRCQYCRSDIVVNPTKFVLNKKKVIRQRRI